jgi:hypothetical protein
LRNHATLQRNNHATLHATEQSRNLALNKPFLENFSFFWENFDFLKFFDFLEIFGFLVEVKT